MAKEVVGCPFSSKNLVVQGCVVKGSARRGVFISPWDPTGGRVMRKQLCVLIYAISMLLVVIPPGLFAQMAGTGQGVGTVTEPSWAAIVDAAGVLLSDTAPPPNDPASPHNHGEHISHPA